MQLSHLFPLLRNRPLSIGCVLALASGAAVACSDSRPVSVSVGPEAGDGGRSDQALVPILLREPDDGDLDDVAIGGVLVVDGGCLYLDGDPGKRLVVAWPHGTRWDRGSMSVTRGGGIGPHNDPPFTLSGGERFSGGGTAMNSAQASTFVAADSQEILVDCLEGDVAVIRAGIRAERPASSVPPTTTAP